MKKLTVILAFLNEGNEVLRTLESLKIDPSFERDCEVIMINDGSTDGYDYKTVADQYNAFYIHHETSMGASYSKNEGVECASTPNFLILDAHMRALTKNWVKRILSSIKKDPQAIYCCGCRSLEWKEEDIYMNDLLGICAMMSFTKKEVFHLDWIVKSKISKCPPILEVPALLGGSYCGRVDYWIKLHGLNHQILFGHEEQMMTLKSWVVGNGVKCITNVEFAHKFRQGVRKYPGWGALFNLMLSAYLVVPEKLFEQTLVFWQKTSPVYNQAYSYFQQHINELQEEKKYIQSIAHRDYQSYEQFNNTFKKKYLNGSKKV